MYIFRPGTRKDTKKCKNIWWITFYMVYIIYNFTSTYSTTIKSVDVDLIKFANSG